MPESLPVLEHVAVLVVGDPILDRFSVGVAHRLSPETPVPILGRVRTHNALGGAANVAVNLREMGVGRVTLAGLIGVDDAGDELHALCAEQAGVSHRFVRGHGRTTTLKHRFLAQGHHPLLRVDDDSSPQSDPDHDAALVQVIDDVGQDHDVVIVSDYAKGTVSEAVMERLRRWRKEDTRRLLVADPKTDFARFTGCDWITPNQRELEQATGRGPLTLEETGKAARVLLDRYGIGGMLVTRAENGMLAVTPQRHAPIAARARVLHDVTGAGDTVVAGFSALLAVGWDWHRAAQLANAAAGEAVGFPFACTLKREQWSRLAQQTTPSDPLHPTEDNVVTWREGRPLPFLDQWRQDGRIVVFTNGCFDPLHPGHLHLLRQARSMGHRLVVGLNGDASVARLKGPHKPSFPAEYRAAMLASMPEVDWVVVFETPTPEELIAHITPQVLVKGDDYRENAIAGADFVRAKGGRIVIIPRLKRPHGDAPWSSSAVKTPTSSPR